MRPWAYTDAIAERSGPDLLEIAPNLGPHWISTEVFDRSLCVDSFHGRRHQPGPRAAESASGLLAAADGADTARRLREAARWTLPPALAAFLPGDEPFYTVYVVPDFDTTADIPPMNMHPSSGATLTVDGLAPGSYHVYVFERPVPAGIPQPGCAGGAAHARASR